MNQHDCADWTLASVVLQDETAFSADRGEYFFPLFCALTSRSLDRLAAHYSEWPMYSDGLLHRKGRRLMQEFLRDVRKKENFFDMIDVDRAFSETSPSGETAGHLAEAFHRTLLGIPSGTYPAIYGACKRIRDFFVLLELPNLDPGAVEQDLSLVEESLASTKAVGADLAALVERGATAGVIVNLIGDTREPVEELLRGAVAWSLPPGDANVELVKQAARDIVSTHAPFSLVNRRARRDCSLAGKDVREGDRVSVHITNLAGSPDGFVGAFGLGPHRCVGEPLVIDLIERVVQARLKLKHST